MDKGSGSGIFPDPDPGDQKRPDPTGSGSATLIKTMLKFTVKILQKKIKMLKNIQNLVATKCY